jgi:hypothetical protein
MEGTRPCAEDVEETSPDAVGDEGARTGRSGGNTPTEKQAGRNLP